jgi:PEGA domain-containing protein
MKLTSFGLTAALLAILTAAPAFAQERDPKRREAARAEHNAQRPAQPPREAAPAEQPRVAQPRAEQPRAEQPRADARIRRDAPRVQAPVQPPAVAPRAEVRGNAVRGNEVRGNEVPGNEVVGRAVPRTAPSYNAGHDHYDHDRYDHRYYAAPRVYVAPRAYFVPRPYVFRPHLSIGFGIFAGYPVPYAWRYSAPIYVYGYGAPRAPVYITPGMPAYGGVALEVSPYDADVFVDGNYAGHVQDFDGTVQPLTLVAGTHRVEVQAPGYAPLVFDVIVQGGQVIPYRGDLRPF